MSTTLESASAVPAGIIEPRELTKAPKAVKSIVRNATAKQLAYRRFARAGGWGLLAGALAGIVAATVPTLLSPWQLVSIGTSLGMSLDYLGLMPSSYRRNLLTKWAKHYDGLVQDGLISEAQRQRQVDVLLSKYGP